jgi:HSP20 family protein
MLRRTDPFAEMFESWRDFDGLFRRLMGERPGSFESLSPRRLMPVGAAGTDFLPAVECFTKDKQLVLRAELPGVDPKDLQVSVLGNSLIIKGEKKEERRVAETDVFFKEIVQGKFERSFDLPEGVKKEQVKACIQNGVLEIVLPAEAVEPERKVPVEVLEPGKKTVRAA